MLNPLHSTHRGHSARVVVVLCGSCAARGSRQLSPLVLHMPIVRFLEQFRMPSASKCDCVRRRSQIEHARVEGGAEGVTRIVPAEPHALRIEAPVSAVFVLVGFTGEAIRGHADVDYIVQTRQVRLRVGSPNRVDIRHEDRCEHAEQSARVLERVRA